MEEGQIDADWLREVTEQLPASETLSLLFGRVVGEPLEIDDERCVWVPDWNRCLSPEEVDQACKRVDDLVAPEFSRKAEAEKTGPVETDFDKLDRAFIALRKKGVIAIHNAGWDKSEALHNCLEEYRSHSTPDTIFGICYYTSQDVDNAIDGNGMYLGYCSTRPEKEETDSVRAGALICEEINKAGLSVDWGGDAKTRIKLKIKWQL